MLASLLPGLRNVRAPLAAGYILLAAAWLAFAPIYPSRSAATGVLADLYSLYSASGKGPALAAATFAAYLVGVISVELTRLLIAGANNFVDLAYSLVPNRYRSPISELAGKLFPLSPGGSSTKARRNAIETVIVRQLSLRYLEDEGFRDEIVSRLSKLKEQARDSGSQLPEPFCDASAADLAADMFSSVYTRVRSLARLIDLRKHAEDLLWESRFAEGSAAATPDVSEERDRSRAEAEFRFGLALPTFVLTLVLAYRASPWFLAGSVISVWLWYMGSVMYAEADGAVLRAVAQGKLIWPAAKRLSTGRIHYRTLQEIVTRRWPATASRSQRRATAEEGHRTSASGPQLPQPPTVDSPPVVS
jgi:hypothetical protein